MTIREIRNHSGLSRAAFSRKYNIPIRTLENWECGTRHSPPYVIDLLQTCVLADLKEEYKLEKVLTISKIRELTKLSIEEFSDKYKIPVWTIEDWEAGRRHCPEYVLELLEICVRRDEKIEFYVCIIDSNDQPKTILASSTDYPSAQDILTFYQDAIMSGKLDNALGLSKEKDRKKARAALTIKPLQAHDVHSLHLLNKE